jgi:hypothetical protein
LIEFGFDSMKNLLGLALISLTMNATLAQSRVGSWQSHLPMGVFTDIAILHEKVIASNKYGLLIYDINEKSKTSLTKVNGLTQTGISTVACNEAFDLCLIGYENGDIDILEGGTTVINQPAIRISNVVGDKIIRDIIFNGDLAYLVTGIGLIQFDLLTYNILEFSRLGFQGDDANMQAANLHDGQFYFTTSNGAFVLSLDDAFTNPVPQALNLSVSTSKINQIFSWNDEIHMLYRNEEDGKDTIYTLTGNDLVPSEWLAGEELRWFDSNEQELLVCSRTYLATYDTEGNLTNRVDEYFIQPGIDVQKAYFSNNAPDLVVADGVHGCVLADFDDQGRNTIVNITSPRDGSIGVLREEDGVIYALPGGNDFTFNVPYLFQFKDNEWSTKLLFTDTNDAIRNPVDIAVFDNRKYVAFDGYGYMVLNRNNEILEHVDIPNTRMVDDQTNYYGLRDIEVDDDGNIWMLNNRSLSTLSLLDQEDNWRNFAPDDFPQASVTDLLLLSNGMLVYAMKDQGMMVYDPGEDLLGTADDRWANITSSPERGGLNNNTVNCFAEDKDGELWIGTDEGIGIIFNIEQVFEPNFSVQKIIVNQDGFNGYLFESDAVVAITVDGADRKWIAPRGAGLFLISSDGQEQLLSFNQDNSPLLNNNISDLALHPNSGELFIATESGLMSYRTDASEPAAELSTIKVFPNPVKPGYSGLISFTGLTPEAYVRITDAAGNLVFETQSQGGTATWNGTTASGDRVPSGVYLMFSAQKDGLRGAMTKLLFLE